MSCSQSTSNSSGTCIHCSVFFVQLASHMVSSERYMLASQKLLLNKRNWSEYDSNAEIKNQNRICNSHMTKRAAQKNNVSDINSDLLLIKHLTLTKHFFQNIHTWTKNKASLLSSAFSIKVMIWEWLGQFWHGQWWQATFDLLPVECMCDASFWSN